MSNNDIKPLISIIVPVYNVEKYISRCIDSILRQTYENLEIILVDDGTKDNSGKICDEYAKKDNRIQVIHQKNMGLSGARNTGIANAHGEYIAFLDSDDYVSDNIYDKLYDCITEYNADIAVCGYERFSGEAYKKTGDTPVEIKELDAKTALGNIYLVDGVIYTVAWNKLYKRSVIADIRYPLRRLNEDEFTTYKFIANASKLVYTSEVLYYYFYNNDSITTKANYVFNTDLYDALDERINYLSDKGYGMFEAKIQRQYLDRIVMRNKKLWSDNTKEIKVQTRRMHRLYQKRYKMVKDMVPGVGYKLYNVSPTLYYFILKIKEK